MELFYPFSLLIFGNSSVEVFKLPLVKILLCLLNREYRIEQISVEFLAVFGKNICWVHGNEFSLLKLPKVFTDRVP